VDFDKVTRGPGFWKFNNSHLQNDRFKEIIRIELALIVSEYQNIDDEEKTLTELLEMAPDQLQKVKLILNPHELMEQIHFALKAKIIKYSIRIQKDRTRNKKEAEKTIRELNEKLQEETITQLQRREVQEMLTNKEAALEKMEEHLAKGTSVRARQEWDINGEGPGKILLKCEEKYGQQKYMQSIIEKNDKGETIKNIT